MVHALEELMADESDTVRFTVGRFECHPGSPATAAEPPCSSPSTSAIPTRR